MGEDNPRAAKHPVEEIAETVGGKITEGGILPDGSGFAIMSMPLPKDHWLTQEGYNVPPMPFRMGSGDYAIIGMFRGKGGNSQSAPMSKQDFSDRIRAVARYAARALTMNGKYDDFDPDALVQNFVTGMLGYHTEDGLSSDADSNPGERTQWCCDGDGHGGHHKKCRYSREDYSTASPPAQG